MFTFNNYFIKIFCSNVAYHGDLQKKAAMEQKRNISGEIIDMASSGMHVIYKNLVY